MSTNISPAMSSIRPLTPVSISLHIQWMPLWFQVFLALLIFTELKMRFHIRMMCKVSPQFFQQIFGSIYLLFWIILLWTNVYKLLCAHMFHFSWYIFRCLIWGVTLSSEADVPFYILTINVPQFIFFYILSNISNYPFLIIVIQVGMKWY